MNDDSLQENPLDRIAGEFVDRYRRGERPALSEYCALHPELADDIRRVFPTLVVMEQARSDEAALGPLRGCTGIGSKLKLEQVGEYRILREIARGGMGIVYEAVQESLGRHVALKVLPTQSVLDPRHVARFHREARVAAKLHHTNIVPVFGVGEHDGLYYYVMQFINGFGLDQVIDEVRKLRDRSVNRTIRTSSRRIDGNAQIGATPAIGPDGGVSVERIAGSLVSGEFFQLLDRDRPVESEVAASRPSAGAASEQRGASADQVDSAIFRVLPPSGSASGSGLHTRRDTTSLSHSGWQYWHSVARVGVQVADAIEYAWGHGILHRDIKPSNLLLDTHGTVWVTDFGLAKATEHDDLTHTGDIVGTLRYLAPERLKGQVDLRGDLYSLGITLYEMLTMRTPFEGHDRSRLIRRVLDEDPLRPRVADPAIPPDLETIVLKAIAKDPAHRYQTAGELASDLRQFLEDKPIAARPVGQMERAWRWCRRNPRVAGLTGTVALLLIAITAVSSLSAVLLKHERDLAREAEKVASAAEKRATAADTSQRKELYRAYRNDARATFLNGRVGQRLHGLDSIRKVLDAVPDSELTPEQRGELRDDAIMYLGAADLREVVRISDHSFARGRPVIDKQLDFVAVSAERGSNTIIRRTSDPNFCIELEIEGADQTQYWTARTFSPSGRWLAEIRHKPPPDTEQQLVVWDWQAKRIVFRRHWAPGLTLAFHPNDRHLLFRDGSARLVIVDIQEQKMVSESPRHARVSQAAFSFDGKLLAIASDVVSEIVNTDTWKTVTALPEATGSLAMAWNPINGQLAFGMSDSRIYVWDEKEQTARFMHAEWIGLLYTLTFSPDGRYLASSGTDNLFHVCDMSQDRMLFKAPGEALRFSADGRRLAAIVDEELVVYEIVNARALNRVPRPGEAAEFSPDGNWLATAGAEGVHLYSADQYRLEADLGLDACGPVAFHPDSGSLVTFGTFSHQQRWPIRLVDRTDGSDNLDSDTLRSRAEPGATDETGLAAGTWRIGPPQPLTDDTDLVSLRLHLPLAPQHFGRQVAISRNGRLLATMNVRSGQLLIADAESAAPPRPFSPFFAIRRVAISPDAQWVAAAGDYVFRHVGVFATADARAIFDIADHASATFSSDGEYFACSSRQEVRLYRVGSWQLERTIPIERPPNMLVIPIAFQPQGRLLAVSNALLYTRLYDRETGRNVANLTHSLTESAHPCWLSFSPDGTQLAVVRSGHDVRIWDLAVLNAELAELGLDEEGLPQRPITQRHAAGHSRSLTVDRGQQLVAPDDWYTLFHELALNEARKNNWPDAITNLKSALQQPKCPTGRVRAELLALRGNYHHYNGDLRAAQDDWHEAIRLAPDLKGAVRSLARLLTLGPAEHRDAGRSFSLIVPLANASQPEPDDLLILAAAQLRLGNNEHALDVLRRVGHLPDIQPYAALLISMAKANLGMLDDANGWYQQAAVEIARRRSTDKELDRLLKEASTLVDLSRQADRERAP